MSYVGNFPSPPPLPPPSRGRKLSVIAQKHPHPNPPPSRGRKLSVIAQNSPPLAGGVGGGGSKRALSSKHGDTRLGWVRIIRLHVNAGRHVPVRVPEIVQALRTADDEVTRSLNLLNCPAVMFILPAFSPSPPPGRRPAGLAGASLGGGPALLPPFHALPDSKAGLRGSSLRRRD